MEKDRGAVLTIKAAARGLVDFRQARILDVRWWRRLNSIIQAMTRDDNLTTIRAAFDYQLAVISNPSIDKEDWKKAQERAKSLFQQTINLVKPWASMTDEEAATAQTNELISAYKDAYGDPDDPVFMAQLERDIAVNRARREAYRAARESEDDRITRLVRERDDRVRTTRK